MSDKRILAGTLQILAMLVAAGCQSPASADTSAQSPAATTARQLIVKFKPNTVTCDAAGIAQLSAATGVTLEFVRAMSGNACVIRQFGSSADDISHGEELLRQNPVLEWLQQDARKRAL